MEPVDKTKLIDSLVDKLEAIIKNIDTEGMHYIIGVASDTQKERVCIAFHGTFIDLAYLSDIVKAELLKQYKKEIDFISGPSVGNA